MATSDELLDLVRSQLGNGGKTYWDWYFGGGYINGAVTPYCACGVSWALAMLNVKAAYFPSAVAFDERDRSIIGDAYVKRAELEPGDIVSFDWNGNGKGDHVGFIEQRTTPTTYRTLEFNTSGGIVARRTRALDVIICGIRPKYSAQRLKLDGVLGALSVAEWQRQTKTEHANKWVGGQVDSSAKYRSSLVAVSYDGGGSRLVAQVQRRIGATPDGYWGRKTSEKLQAYLVELGHELTVDGYFGAKSAKALQTSLNRGEWRL